MNANELAEIIEHLENASHHEGIAHAGGFETGYQAGLRKAQEK